MTVCPGSEWTQGNRWRDLLFERAGQIQHGSGLKTVRHYVLFSAQGERPAAGDEFVNAVAYMARFRPTIGFSVDEARSAEFVTIIGNESGIAAAQEEVLLQAGCKVERIGGRDAAETSHLLAELARAGRRFRSYEVDF